MGAPLVGKTVLIRLSDPWELGESFGWEPLSAVVISAKGNDHGGALLVRLDSPFTYKDVRCEYFVARPRHEGSNVEELLSGSPVLCSITRISEERLKAQDPFDLSWWRGGVAGIGAIVRA
jgi:hypothetical protein